MTFTVAHLSDIHLGPIVGFKPAYWNTKRAIGFYNWRRNRRSVYRRDVLDRLVADMHAQNPDHIAISGDLINIGLPGEMEQALRWLETIGPPERVSVVPGNHDIYSRIGTDHGVARWAAYMKGDAQAVTDNAAPFPYVRRIGPIALVGLNSAIETPPMIARGRLGASQRHALGQMLDALAAENVFRLVMIHHPPIPGLTRNSHALTDASETQALLARHGAELVIHGHLHRNLNNVVTRTNGARPVPVIGVPSAALGKPHGHEPLARYNLYRLAPANDGWSITMTGRGLSVPGGPIADLQHAVL